MFRNYSPDCIDHLCENCIVKSFEIFNRLGQIVFDAANAKPNDPGSGWKGNSRGTDDPTGTYVYDIRIEKDGVNEIYRGTVTLIR